MLTFIGIILHENSIAIVIIVYRKINKNIINFIVVEKSI
jgi:hypothetical protein